MGKIKSGMIERHRNNKYLKDPPPPQEIKILESDTEHKITMWETLKEIKNG